MAITRKSILLVFFFISFIALGLFVLFSPLRSNEMSIRNSILEDVPIGTSRRDVEAYLQGKEIRIIGAWENSDKRSVTHIGSITGDRADKRIMSGSIHGHLGWYRGFPFRVDVVGFWIFDSNKE